MTESIGYWRWTWSPSVTPPAGSNLGIAFSGYTDTTEALANSAQVMNGLVGTKYISLGGGNASGVFDAESLVEITEAIQQGSFAGYGGIAFDVEEYSGDLRADFAKCFAAAQAAGFDVLVTVSHSAPYGAPSEESAQQLMASFFADANIGIISPQLYTTGTEAENDYATSQGVEWSSYATAKAAVCPSIVQASYYDSAVSYFQGQGVTLSGFVQWSQQ